MYLPLYVQRNKQSQLVDSQSGVIFHVLELFLTNRTKTSSSDCDGASGRYEPVCLSENATSTTNKA